MGTPPSSQAPITLFILHNSGLICFTGKILNSLCQAALNAFTNNTDTVVSPAAVLVLSINSFLLSMAEIVLEIYVPRERVPEQDN